MTTPSRTHLTHSHLLPLLTIAALLAGSVAPGFGQVIYQRLRAFGFVELSSTVPVGALIEGTNGALYGLSQGGGQSENGTLFRLNKDGSGFAILKSFSGTNGDGKYPATGLLLATNGSLYGTTYSGGYSNVGIVFRIDQDGSNYAILKSFTGDAGDGAAPVCALLQATNGVLYGTTLNGGDHGLGAIFRINPDGSGYSVFKSFAGGTTDGAKPRGALFQAANGMLFGTTTLGGTNNQGTVFTVDLQGNGYQVLRHYTGTLGDGAQPYAALVQGNDGTLYGTTYSGGTASQGTIFQMQQDGSAYQVIQRFTGSGGANPFAPLIFGTNGVLYGTTLNGGAYANGTVFQINPNGSGYHVIKNYLAGGQDGAQPEGALLQASDGALYGVTGYGGLGSSAVSSGDGTAFTFNPDGTGYTVIRNFSGAGGDGWEPSPLVLATNGVLYGTTSGGGSYGQGTVFKINKDGTGYALLRSFMGTNANPALPDGARPAAGLLQGTDGALYGTTTTDYQVQVGNYGLVFGNGTVFKLNLDGNGYQVLKRFAGGNDGSGPYGSLIQANNGLLYGTTMSGGANGVGIIFKLSLNGTGYAVLTNFANATGYECLAALLQGSDGALYGTTASGGAAVKGTVFKLNLDGSGLQVLTQFFGTNGASGGGPLIQGQDGALYGTAGSGGSSNAGIVFKLNLDGSGFAVLRNFTGLNGDGKSPQGALVQGSNGILFGTTSSGGANPPGVGTVFQLNPDGTGYVVLRSFIQDFYDGILPRGGLIQSADGTLYGTTSAGARDQNGTIYSLVPPAVMLPPTRAETGRRLAFLGLSGRSYSIQRAPATSGPWTSLGTVPVGSNGVGEIDDPNPPPDQAFYRTASP